MTTIAAVVLATFARPRIEWLPCLIVTPDNEVVEGRRPVEVTSPRVETPMDVLRRKAK